MTAKIARIHRSYDKLGNQERLRLVANAIRRDDDDEYKVLVDTTPTKTYSMKDAWVGDRAEALWKISISFCFATEELLRGRDQQRHLQTILEVDMDSLLKLPADDPRREKRLTAIELTAIHLEEYDNLLWAVGEAARRLANEVDLKVDELLAYIPEERRNRLDWPRHDYPEGDDADESNLKAVVDNYYRVFAHHWPGLEVDHECA